jgi:hypothetical protein
VPWGGARPGSGRKKKSAKQHFLSGNAGKRKLVAVERGDFAPRQPLSASPVEALAMPVDKLRTEAEQAWWAFYLPRALATGTLTDDTLGGFIDLCQTAARLDTIWEDIEREGYTFVVEGVPKAHPLWPNYRGLLQKKDALLQRFMLTAMGKPASDKPAPEDEESDVLRKMMSIR